jgi:hypothetical protein
LPSNRISRYQRYFLLPWPAVPEIIANMRIPHSRNAVRMCVVIVIALGFSACVHIQGMTSSGIKTRVVDAQTHAPISGAIVSLMPSVGDIPTRSASTGADGTVNMGITEGMVWHPIYGDFYPFENVHVTARGYVAQDLDDFKVGDEIELQSAPNSTTGSAAPMK